jgi:hypothetical protein
MAEDALGMPELREVLHRLHEQSRRPDEAPLGPDEITAIANHLYQGTNDGTRATNPGYWSHLARIRDPNTQDLDPISAQIRQKQWQGWTGPGWSPEERTALGREPQRFELSPGDRTSHQWMRDSQYLHDVLGRSQTVKPDDIPASVSAWGGSPVATHDQQAQKNLEEALYWYKRGDNATHSVTPSVAGTVAGLTAMGHGTSNFKQYSDLGGFFDASDNPDYAFGHLTTQYMDPLGYAVQKQAMRDPTEKESQYWQDVRNSWTPAAIIPPVYDFFRNALRSDAQSTVPDAIDVARGAQFSRHSPNLPTPSNGMSAEDRVRELQRLRAATASARNMTFDDYHYGKTGQLPSKAGSMSASIAANSIDPSIVATGLMGAGVGAVMGKNVSSYAAMAGELAEDFFPNVALTGALATVPFDSQTKPVPFKDWFTPGDEARTDLPKESQQDRMARIQAHPSEQDSAIAALAKANKAVPPPVNRSPVHMNSASKF